MKRTILFTAAGGLLLASCTTQMYVSNAVNAPLLKEKGEIQVALTGRDLQAAVAVAKNVGIMASGYYQNYTADNNYQHDGILGEAGVGYFTPLAGNFIFESYVGAGAGRVHKQKMFTAQNNVDYMGSFNANASRLFIQPDIGFKTRFLDAVISSRFSFVKYTRFSQTNYPQNELANDYLDNDRLTKPVFMFAEPAITLRGGYKFIKLQFQYGFTINMTPHPIRHASDFSSIGLIFDIGRWYNE